MNQQNLLQRLDLALKDVLVDTSALGDAVLAEQKFDRFVEAMQARTVIIPEARFIRMESQITEIDKIGFVNRVLTRGIDTTGAAKGTEAFVAPTITTNKLYATELRGKVALTDRALRRNIERGEFENTLVDLFGNAAGRDFEEYALLSDTDYSDASDILALGDGWVKQAGNKVYGQGTADFDPDEVEDIFDALINAIDKQYLVNRADWRLYVPYELEDAYRDKLRARGTVLGDSAQTTAEQLRYKGIPVVYAPMLERSADVGSDGAGRIAMLQNPDNMAWGVFHEVTIEPYRNADARQTEFYLTIEADAGYEDEDAAAVALLDQSE